MPTMFAAVTTVAVVLDHNHSRAATISRSHIQCGQTSHILPHIQRHKRTLLPKHSLHCQLNVLAKVVVDATRLIVSRRLLFGSTTATSSENRHHTTKTYENKIVHNVLHRTVPKSIGKRKSTVDYGGAKH